MRGLIYGGKVIEGAPSYSASPGFPSPIRPSAQLHKAVDSTRRFPDVNSASLDTRPQMNKVESCHIYARVCLRLPVDRSNREYHAG